MGLFAPQVTVGLLLLLPFLLACRATDTPTPEVIPTPLATVRPAGTVTVTPNPGPPTISPSAALTVSAQITLTVWTTEDLSPSGARGGRTLRAQIDAYTRAHPNVRVDWYLKKPGGPGGLLDFMLNTQAVVPSLLPDLIALSSNDLDAAAQTGLLQPLGDDFPAGSYADLFPPAQKLARWQGQWLYLPLVLDAEHLVINSDKVKRAPRTWDETLAGGATLLIPADGDDAFLLQYIAAGGQLVDANGAPMLNPDVASQVLGFFRRARDQSIIPDSALALGSVQEVWPLYAAGSGSMAQVSAVQVLNERDKAPPTSVAPMPTRDGNPATLVSAWGYAITTTDPARRRTALDLLAWLDGTDRLAEWARAARLIPARRTAFAAALDASDYTNFIRGLLDAGYPDPPNGQIARQSAAWHAAMQAVMKGQATPAEAATRAASSLK